MKKRFFASAMMAASVLIAPMAMAEQSVTFNGRIYTCTNQCVITVTGNTYTVTDSGGGTVTVRIPSTHDK
jgi:hypothetical protein